MKKQEVIQLMQETLEVISYDSHRLAHRLIIPKIEQAIVALQLPTTKKPKKILSAQHRQKIAQALKNNRNNPQKEKPARDMVWVKDATGALIQQPAPRKRNPMRQETKEKIASSMLGNKNGAKGI